MTKHVEVPEGVMRFTPVFQRGPNEAANMQPDPTGGYFAVEDLPLIYKHFCDRILSDEAKQAAIQGLSYRLGHVLNEAAVAVVLEEALRATSIPEQGISDVLLDQANALALDAELDELDSATPQNEEGR
jgi:hypothetical protein